jgi:hypothetical protein
MIDSGARKAVLCSILGTAVIAVSVCADRMYENEDTVYVDNMSSSEVSSDNWKAETGRYSMIDSVSETTVYISSETATDETSADTEVQTSFSEISTSAESSSSTEITSSETSVTVSDSVTSVVSSQTSVVTSSTEPAETTSAYTPPSNPVPASQKADISYLDDAVFVGDSIMEGMSAYSFFPESRVFASVGLNPYQLNTNAIDTYYGNTTALSAVMYANPSKIYIMMGMNGVAWDINDDMTEQISIFIDNLREKLPSAKIYLMTVTPVSAEREAKPSVAEGKILNSQIDNFNKSLLNLADEKGIYYLDVNSSLKGSNGCLPSDVSSDGIHLSKAVYEQIIDYILTHTVK